MPVDLNVTLLPLEIQEQILELLDGDSLRNAQRVCPTWNEICERCLQLLCLKTIPDDILTELFSEVSSDACWGDVWKMWSCGEITEAPLQQLTSLNLPDLIASTTVLGEYFIVGSGNGSVILYSLADMRYIYRTELEEGSIYQMVSMKAWNLIFALGESSIHSLKVAPNGKITVLECESLPLLCRKFSTYYDQIILNTKMDVLSVYRINEVTKQKVILNHEATVTCPKWVYEWKLWENKLTCLLSSGEVCVWDMDLSTWSYISSPYAEIQYQNPCWMFRDSIFCSSLTSRCLLAYWHMDRGVYYWMLSWSGPQLNRVYLGEEQGEEVTCLCLQRQLFICGTKSGNILVFSCGKRTSQSSHSEFDISSPLIITKVSEKHIRGINIGFGDDKIYIIARTSRTTAELLQIPKICDS